MPGRMSLLMDSQLIAAAATKPRACMFLPCPPKRSRRGEMRWVLSERQAILAAHCKQGGCAN